MKVLQKGPTIVRVLLGLIFFVFGLNGFLHFIPQPATIPERAMGFVMALMSTGYMFPLIKGVEVVGGAMLLSNRFVPLALALLAPNVVNILLFHAFLEPQGIPLAIVLLVLEIYLAWAYRNAYRPMLAARVQPVAASEAGGTAPAGAVHARSG